MATRPNDTVRGEILQIVDESNLDKHAVYDEGVADWIEDGNRVAVITCGSSHPIVERMHRGLVARVIPFAEVAIHRTTDLQKHRISVSEDVEVGDTVSIEAPHRLTVNIERQPGVLVGEAVEYSCDEDSC